jgi:hypothetical protein
MAEETISVSQEMQRAELDAVLEALARSPRLTRLLRYLGERYFQGESDQLNEYNIATEVFERSKTTFDAGEDAIARVEAHRLRKRLKQYYQEEGRDHVVQLSLPSGSYVPVFSLNGQSYAVPPPLPSLDALEEAEEGSSVAANGEPEAKNGAWPRWRALGRRNWALLLVLAVLLLGTVAGIVGSHLKPATNKDGASVGPPATPTAVAPVGVTGLPIRLIAGYTGRPIMDSSGALWQPDNWFKNGGTWQRPNSAISRTSDPQLFERWRTGDFFYDIPLPPGVYELHLYFVTTTTEADPQATFTIGINGNSVLQAFDVNSDALGEGIADERIFHDVSPGKDGYLHIAFTSERGAPSLNALEILPGIPHKQLPIRLVAQTLPFTDHNGQFWHPDNYFMNGRLSTYRQQITGTPDPDVFAAERFGHFSYAIPVDPHDRYTLILHFAEFYFGPQASGHGGAGSRVFKVMCNGNTLLDDFDIFKEAGSLHALTKTFYHLKPSAQGKLNLVFEPILNNATISGIEVLDESE